MHILPKARSDLLVVPLLVWIPIAVLRMVGFQAEHTADEMGSTLRMLGIITAILAIPFCAGIYLKLKS